MAKGYRSSLDTLSKMSKYLQEAAEKRALQREAAREAWRKFQYGGGREVPPSSPAASAVADIARGLADAPPSPPPGVLTRRETGGQELGGAVEDIAKSLAGAPPGILTRHETGGQELGGVVDATATAPPPAPAAAPAAAVAEAAAEAPPAAPLDYSSVGGRDMDFSLHHFFKPADVRRVWQEQGPHEEMAEHKQRLRAWTSELRSKFKITAEEALRMVDEGMETRFAGNPYRSYASTAETLAADVASNPEGALTRRFSNEGHSADVALAMSKLALGYKPPTHAVRRTRVDDMVDRYVKAGGTSALTGEEVGMLKGIAGEIAGEVEEQRAIQREEKRRKAAESSVGRTQPAEPKSAHMKLMESQARLNDARAKAALLPKGADDKDLLRSEAELNRAKAKAALQPKAESDKDLAYIRKLDSDTAVNLDTLQRAPIQDRAKARAQASKFIDSIEEAVRLARTRTANDPHANSARKRLDVLKEAFGVDEYEELLVLPLITNRYMEHPRQKMVRTLARGYKGKVNANAVGVWLGRKLPKGLPKNDAAARSLIKDVLAQLKGK